MRHGCCPAFRLDLRGAVGLIGEEKICHGHCLVSGVEVARLLKTRIRVSCPGKPPGSCDSPHQRRNAQILSSLLIDEADAQGIVKYFAIVEPARQGKLIDVLLIATLWS